MVTCLRILVDNFPPSRSSTVCRELRASRQLHSPTGKNQLAHQLRSAHFSALRRCGRSTTDQRKAGAMLKSHKGILTFILGLSMPLVGCTPAPTSGKGFTLPTGDGEQGKVVFMSHNCHQCHKVEGVERPAEEEREMDIALGGEVRRISTYGELVTAIINPSHKLAKGYAEEDVSEEGESKMENYNDVLTVTELIDLVAFLQSKYSIRPPDVTNYPMYY